MPELKLSNRIGSPPRRKSPAAQSRPALALQENAADSGPAHLHPCSVGSERRRNIVLRTVVFDAILIRRAVAASRSPAH